MHFYVHAFSCVLMYTHMYIYSSYILKSLRPAACQDPFSPYAGTGGPEDGSFTNLATNQPEKRFNGGNIQDSGPPCSSWKGVTRCLAIGFYDVL